MVDILELIPEGHANAVDREYLSSITGLCDRKVRQLIEEACTKEHPILNMQDGKGYFRPLPKVSELDKYIKAGSNEVDRNQISLSELPGWNGR